MIGDLKWKYSDFLVHVIVSLDFLCKRHVFWGDGFVSQICLQSVTNSTSKLSPEKLLNVKNGCNRRKRKGWWTRSRVWSRCTGGFAFLVLSLLLTLVCSDFNPNIGNYVLNSAHLLLILFLMDVQFKSMHLFNINYYHMSAILFFTCIKGWNDRLL